MTKPLAQLPQETVDTLLDLKTNNRTEFLLFVLNLRAANWPLRAIAEPFGVSRAAASLWVKQGQKLQSDGVAATLQLTVPPIPVTTYGQKYKPVKVTPNVKKSDVEYMRNLFSEAKKVTRWSDPSSPEKIAASKLEELILYYTQQRKVPVATIANHLGVTRRAIAQRIEKYK